ncbi:hypothetical protein Tel_09200 [Candidatus Tenderia electrophaga]|jgi:hypothetical protein|uniref:Uncharacterized protein n=1 Tax=Candidatus Tenderia electrophaga TaxID=1748243 RepID=A0A0S2TDY5_9GAMM|nr:hypothetical protein Tel_09200 [Candidatus Tenderia electrophaga]
MAAKQLRILFTIIFVIAFGLIATQALDERGQEYTDDALQRSLLTFGVARALNGVISVAQGTEIALQPAGVGLTFTPGQILDPINDLVERFSWVMLMSSASIGIQKTLLMISAWPWFSGTTLFILICTTAMLWLPKTQSRPATKFMLKLSLLVLVLRLSVPCIAIGSEWVYQGFLAPQYNEATAKLEKTKQNIGQINESITDTEPAGKASGSIWKNATQLYRSASKQVDIDAQLERLKIAAAEISEYLIDLIVVFVFQTVLLPLIFLGGLYFLLKSLLNKKYFVE